MMECNAFIMKYVLDSGLFMNLHEVPDIPGEHFITSSAINEIKSSNSRHIFDLFQSKHRLSIIDPEDKFLKKIMKETIKIGQIGLSSVDKDVLALLLKLSEYDVVTLISDDYALRNIAHSQKIESIGFKTKGGNQFRKYKYTCQGCNTKSNESISECEVCGHTVFKRSQR